MLLVAHHFKGRGVAEPSPLLALQAEESTGLRFSRLSSTDYEVPLLPEPDDSETLKATGLEPCLLGVGRATGDHGGQQGAAVLEGGLTFTPAR